MINDRDTVEMSPSHSLTKFGLPCLSIERKSVHDLGESLAANALAPHDFAKCVMAHPGVTFQPSNSDFEKALLDVFRRVGQPSLTYHNRVSPILTSRFSTLEPALSGVEGVGSTGDDARKGPSHGLALVKLDFLIGTKWGSNVDRKQKPPSREPRPPEERS